MFQKFKALSRLKKIGLCIVAFFVIGTAGAATHPQTQNVNDTRVLGTQTTEATHQKKAPIITSKTETETQLIPFTTTTVSDPTLPKGTTKITTQGVNGVSTLTYQVTYSDGKQTKKELLSQVTTTPLTAQVTAIGTYVAPAQPTCPNGTYVNTYGNTVCSPYSSNSVPEGATARCIDGTYSFSQSHSGTCSHHGGVSEWL
jgi:hypothetical protein